MDTKGFIQVWATGYVSPVRMVEALRSRPAPQWGFWGQLLRALLDSFLVYLPVTLMGRIPPTPSNLSFVSTEHYYGALLLLTPIVLGAQWLMAGAFIHVVLRLSRRPSDFDQILNIVGMAGLVVGAFLIPWDWAWFAIGGVDQYFLGTSHLILSLWATLITVIGLNRILGVPVWLGGLLGVLAIVVAVPFAIMFMRSPF